MNHSENYKLHQLFPQIAGILLVLPVPLQGWSLNMIHPMYVEELF
jgi:hypothetical protein